uniref:Uncharacterized protein n=1 Tax=Candidatus Kentrum eta TaxID=2126337 RepID=A0A450VNW9_9GAMM|nr:MAG: hypothetical protein BECKH772B_GA0070898_103492 [Candidatus Kentron sp. H]VFK03667.1 MAG: hypothetical protein BECKH772A_GA0070896_103442 [Candidatus Kentron sp. H]VFK06441.1 MAG: hypothetical protein BECKH772C_GA0070978_103502 [Candidatus Kentron sp. H]
MFRSRDEKFSTMVTRLTRWFIFSIVIALLPVWFHLSQSWQGSSFVAGLVASCSHGELLLVTAAILGAAIGELIGSSNRALSAKLVVGGDPSLYSFWYPSGSLTW